MPDPYYYVRYAWWKTYDLKELAAKLKERFTLVKPPTLSENTGGDIDFVRHLREEIEVKADTIFAPFAL